MTLTCGHCKKFMANELYCNGTYKHVFHKKCLASLDASNCPRKGSARIACPLCKALGSAKHSPRDACILVDTDANRMMPEADTSGINSGKPSLLWIN